MTVEDMLAAGYREFHDQGRAHSLGSWYRKSYQKRISDRYGIRYFITISHSVIPHGDMTHLSTCNQFFTPSDQFKRDGMVFNIEMLYHDETIEQVETFFAKLWEKMRLDYYEEY